MSGAMATTTREDGRVELAEHGIEPAHDVFWNPTTSLLYNHSVERGEGRIAEGGALAVDTGEHTGRSPKDKFVVREPGSEERIWWGDVTRDLGGAFRRAARKGRAHLGGSHLYVVDAFAGADPEHRIAVRVITNHPYHELFARTMFIDPSEDELRDSSRKRWSCMRPSSRPIPPPTGRARARSSSFTRRVRSC